MTLEELRALRKQIERTIRSNINASTAALPVFERIVLQQQLATKLRTLAAELEDLTAIDSANKEMYS